MTFGCVSNFGSNERDYLLCLTGIEIVLAKEVAVCSQFGEFAHYFRQSSKALQCWLLFLLGSGMLTFMCCNKAKPKARNPKTGEIIYVAARRKTHFKPGKLLKEVMKQPL